MKIELRNIEIYSELIKENIAFSADLYIENKRVGRASNNGADGRTIYLANASGYDLIAKAKEHLKKLPPLIYEDKKTFKYPITLERTLENLIDDFVSKHLSQERFHTTLATLMPNSIVFGKKDEPLRYVPLKFPIEDILKLKNGAKILEEVIRERVLPRMVQGDSIFNTNIPAQLISLGNSIESKKNTSVTDLPCIKQKINRNRKRGL